LSRCPNENANRSSKFERVEQLSDEFGQRALQSVVEQDEVLLRQLHSCNGSESRGLFVLITDEEAFDHALATAYAERMRHGRSWSGYCLSAPLIPSKNPSDIALLEGDLSAYSTNSTVPAGS
jgi:hypothetical protein